MSSLGIRNLYKYDWRVELFLKKFENGDLFELKDGKQIAFFYDETVIDRIKKREKIKGPFLQGEDLCFYRLTDLQKSKEFGGELNVHAEEQKQIDVLNDEIFNLKQSQATNSIKISINKTFYSVSSVEKTKGSVKSDFHFVSPDNTPILWISHKKGSTSRHFQQWGGVSKFNNHEEVIQFADDVKTLFPDGIDPTASIIREIRDEELMIKSVYGENYGKDLEENNVSLVIHGDIALVSNNDHFELTAEHIRFNGQLPLEEFKPVFTATYRKLRNDFLIPNTRITVSPIGGRTSIII